MKSNILKSLHDILDDISINKKRSVVENNLKELINTMEN